jgi:pyruvate kinase
MATHPADNRPDGPDVVPVDADWIARRRPGDLITLRDTRDAARTFQVADIGPDTCVAEVWDTTYLETGMTLTCDGDRAVVGPLAAVAQFHLLRIGDELTLTRSLEPVEPWHHGEAGSARIGCTLPELFTVAQPGQRLIFDDGRIAGQVESVGTDSVLVRVTGASPNGSKLRCEKSINLPEMVLPIPVITDADLPLIELAVRHADMLALSFVRDEHDVDLLLAYLGRFGAGHLGLVMKIETTSAFARLPEILLRAMRSSAVGVMIARGDLAVEAGFERLAEMQEEILWICEAAHLPVIWATEVLDQLAHTGRPTRAEVTDAAMAQRAECVMLNKGPHIDSAIELLDDILRRMAGHQRKKAAQLRPLCSWVDAL